MAGLRRNAADRAEGGLATIDVLGAVALALLGVALRFVTTSPLWLDEALSVNIASLPLGDIGDALRRDGHPPLYYWLLHGWMSVFGDGDVAVRSLSGVAGVLGLPLAWEAGRRRAGTAGGLCVLALTAIMPWFVRYGTEARMYSMVATLVLAGWLLADDLLRRSSRWRWVALAIVTGGALLSHYWTINLCVAAVGVLTIRWYRGDSSERAGVVRVGSAIIGGGVLFLPWVPAFLDQLRSTGTPWASAGRPTAAVADLMGALGGGARYAEAVLFGVGFYVLVLLGVALVPDGGRRAVLDFGTVPGVRGEAAVALLAASVGLTAGLLTDAAFQARYAAAFLPLLVVAAGVGLARLPSPGPRRIATGALALLAFVGLGGNVIDDRTQGRQVALAIASDAGPSDVVAVCPDQLGPAALRSLPATQVALGLPSFERPERIDWRDYADRNEAADPDEAVQRLLELAGEGSVWMVINTGYRTYEGYCEAVLGGLQAARSGSRQVVEARPEEVFEPMHLYVVPASDDRSQAG